ncbi:MAG: IPT/TIG domain-containing protein [Chitinophagaceae bacterium]|nr:IPT/TIG domain-containing protein [Chitinophagaceae bacterium]
MMRILHTFVTIIFFAGTLWAQPGISSFSPASGPVGTMITINGTNFDPVAANNIVFLGV